MPDDLLISPASPDRSGEILTLQRAAYVTEAQLCGEPSIPPLTQTLEELRAELADPSVTALAAWCGDRMVGSVRVRSEGPVAHVERLVVAPDQQGRGIGSRLLLACEEVTEPAVRELRLFTGARSAANLRFYARHGYERCGTGLLGPVRIVHLVKPVGRPV